VTHYRNQGKQVLKDDQHFADAVSVSAAEEIVEALQPRRAVTAPLRLNTCRARQEQDEMACPCGLRWAIDDPDPPLCVHRAPR